MELRNWVGMVGVGLHTSSSIELSAAGSCRENAASPPPPLSYANADCQQLEEKQNILLLLFISICRVKNKKLKKRELEEVTFMFNILNIIVKFSERGFQSRL